MPRSWIQKGSAERRRLASQAVYELLPTDASELQWSALKQEAAKRGISSSTLSLHLKALIKSGMVSRRVDQSTYPPSVYYRLAVSKLFPTHMVEFILASRKLEDIANIISDAKDEKLSLKLCEATVKAHIWMLSSFPASLLYGSLGGKGPYRRSQTEKMTEQRLDEWYKQYCKDVHDAADEMLDAIMRPWIHKLLDVVLTHDVEDAIMTEGETLMEAADKKLKELTAILQEVEASER